MANWEQVIVYIVYRTYIHDVFFNGQNGRTALNHAAKKGSKECLKVLVHEFQADPEEVDIVSRDCLT